jgi:hypothetical protein
VARFFATGPTTDRSRERIPPLDRGTARRYTWSMRPRGGVPPRQFEEFQASELFCTRCQAARPVRERLLLVLPDGELYEYLCVACGASVGKRTATGPPSPLLVSE